MSSILKALRRLEEERARKSHEAPQIAANLLRSDTRRRQVPLWFWPTVVAVVLGGAALLFWVTRPAPVPPPAAPQASVPASRGESGNPLIIEEVVDHRRPVATSAPSTSSPLSAPAATAPVVAPPLQNQPAAVSVPPVAPPLPSVAAAIAERTTPSVTAIAWQEERATRMAVVDGLPVMIGEAIGNAKVEEILPDRVIFVESGQTFSVRMATP